MFTCSEGKHFWQCQILTALWKILKETWHFTCHTENSFPKKKYGYTIVAEILSQILRNPRLNSKMRLFKKTRYLIKNDFELIQKWGKCKATKFFKIKTTTKVFLKVSSSGVPSNRLDLQSFIIRIKIIIFLERRQKLMV